MTDLHFIHLASVFGEQCEWRYRNDGTRNKRAIACYDVSLYRDATGSDYLIRVSVSRIDPYAVDSCEHFSGRGMNGLAAATQRCKDRLSELCPELHEPTPADELVVLAEIRNQLDTEIAENGRRGLVNEISRADYARLVSRMSELQTLVSQ